MRLSLICFRRFKYGVGDITAKYANFPESYVKRTVDVVEWRTPRGYPQYLPKEIVHKKRNYGIHRPWTTAFNMDNQEGQGRHIVILEPLGKWSYFKGDRVEILTGPDKGKQGIICQVFQERNWVTVEGLNTRLEVAGKTSKLPGTVVAIEQPLLVKREVKHVDPADLKATDIEWRFTEEGDQVRVSVRTGRIIPIPIEAEETNDYKTKSTYKESPQDTKTDEITKVTFAPSLKTFEMDIMESMGIKEDREPHKTYWY